MIQKHTFCLLTGHVFLVQSNINETLIIKSDFIVWLIEVILLPRLWYINNVSPQLKTWEEMRRNISFKNLPLIWIAVICKVDSKLFKMFNEKESFVKSILSTKVNHDQICHCYSVFNVLTVLYITYNLAYRSWSPFRIILHKGYIQYILFF